MHQTAFFEALGWSLIDSLWQAGAIWVAYIFITRNGSRFSADKRHTLALLGALGGTLLFFCSIVINIYSEASNSRTASFGFFIPYLSFLYLPTLFFFSLRMLFQLVIQRNGYRKNLLPANDELSSLVYDISERFGIYRNTVIWLSEKIESPLTVGFLKPVILLPIAAFSHLSYRQIEAVIAHELFHIKRNDYLLNIFLTLSETVLFFNPFSKLLVGIVRKERENSCDDLVIAAGFDAWDYSEALYILGRFRHQQGRLSIAATGIGKEYLLQRIRRIMQRQNPQPSFLKPVLAFFLCLAVAGFASRNKQTPVLVEASSGKVITPVVYYSSEKQMTVAEPVVVTTRSEVTRSETTVEVVDVPPPPAAPPPPVEDVPPAVESDDVVMTSFASAPEAIEFTLIDHDEPVVPEVICESPQPYVPKSTFYFTEVDTLSGKKIISL